MIPWTVGQQFQDPEFPLLSGARIVRIATHPDVSGAGYGSRAVECLKNYYQGLIQDMDDEDADEPKEERRNGKTTAASSQGVSWLRDQKIAWLFCYLK